MIGVLFVVLNSLLISVSSVCFKLASAEIELSRPWSVVRNKWVIFGLLTTPAILFLNVYAYRFGDISALHPMLQLSLVWNGILAVFIFKERLTTRTLIGTALVLCGAVLITLST